FGYAGGAVLAICTAPQIYVMIKNKSAKDVSLLYACLYLFGLTLTLVYMVLLEATAATITISFEVFLAIIVLILKLVLD
ncbi:hypothetical protein EDD86DRAFT_181123, partial [Gorgonomyces haynaldii]